ncbi:PP2C family protein-serine/threonine phosphatase [Streptosporangium roseum]|uniref:PAS/PAC sensor protein n=1 Tax=Streptosporangium roseum (strain ATCC 12428 / DSM 43021 / JCM 3005 / KCTC 9067 / NCIMB 10171 / NRRL 2505 / NI 9100) TaxID=479432 RepID=D2B4F6_STRRD|nr:SpoIIE family protein phosphatase [Streptosporangium roseum]ACZ83642.1 putative PAS/PAC sensor protein [Streptosporangium roseum DSM 43021]
MTAHDDAQVTGDALGVLEDLYEDAPCGYLSTRGDGMIIKVNRTMLALTGYRRQELVGRIRIHDLLAVGDRILYETHFAPLLALQAGVKEIAVDLRRADGSRVPVLLNAVMKEQTPARPEEIWIGVVAASDRRGYERELLQARQRAEESQRRAVELARTLQESFIPPELPRVPGMDVAGMYRPAGQGDEVGGDFYDMYEIVDGWALTLGDVCGKGVQAAVVTSLARYTLRAAPLRESRPSAILATLNEVLVNERTDRFLTAVYAQVHRDARDRFRLTLALGGHPPAFHLSKEGRVSMIGHPGTVLGILDSVELHDVTVDLAPGDVVVFYTDGVVEGRGRTGFFGEERMRQVLSASRDADAADIAGHLMDEVVAFQSGMPSDDIAIVVLKIPD